MKYALIQTEDTSQGHGAERWAIDHWFNIVGEYDSIDEAKEEQKIMEDSDEKKHGRRNKYVIIQTF